MDVKVRASWSSRVQKMSRLNSAMIFWRSSWRVDEGMNFSTRCEASHGLTARTLTAELTFLSSLASEVSLEFCSKAQVFDFRPVLPISVAVVNVEAFNLTLSQH